MTKKRRPKRRHEPSRPRTEPVVDESCHAEWGSPCSGTELMCDQPAGHDGPHHVEWEWET